MKFGSSYNIGRGHAISFGIGWERKAPAARVAFSAPQINNNFALGLKSEKIFSTELGYQLETTWLHANVSAYYSRLGDVAEYSMYYDDAENSFTYASITGIKKQFYGIEAGLNFKINTVFNVKVLGTIADAKYSNDANIVYMRSQDGVYKQDILLNKNMREGGTPLSAFSVDLGYRKSGWYVDLIGNYYDRIYLYYTPVTRYKNENLTTDNAGNAVLNRYGQAKGHSGFMLNGSISKNIYLRHHGQLRFNLMLNNILNSDNIVTGGMEQNRKDRKSATDEDMRAYKFQLNPKKFYANGFNGMFMITYLF